MLKNDTKNINSQCQVVFFNWNSIKGIEDLTLNQLAEAEPIDVSKYLTECTFSKNLGDPAGSFEVGLPNDRDWKQFIQRGAWGLVYMSQEGALAFPSTGDVPNIQALKNQKEKLRAIVFVERVTVKGNVTDDGTYEADFTVSGRDFGVVYLENEIFYNQIYAEGKWQEAVSGQLRIQGESSVTTLLEVLHNAFFAPQDLGIPLDGDSLLQSVPLQWLMPTQLFQALNIQGKDGRTFYGSIPDLLKFDESKCAFPVENAISQVNGKAWDRLKAYSIEPFHELFPELDDNGNPRLTFRYIPWKLSDGKALGHLNSAVPSFYDVPRVVTPALDIISFDLGEDTHSRYNYFLTVIETEHFNASNCVTELADINPKTGFPRIQKNSIRRNGLRLMYSTVNAMIQQGSNKYDKELLRLHNELMLEYWNNAVFMESGTITIVGSNEIRVGKVLELEAEVPYNGGKLFYIEGYTDTFVKEGENSGFWTQTLTLTRGIYPNKIGERGEAYTENGEFTEQK